LYSKPTICSLTVRSCDYWISELAQINLCLLDYFTSVVYLHIANRIAEHSFNDELLDVLATTVDQLVGRRRYCHQLSSELSLNQAVILMKVVRNDSCSTVQQIEIELSKAYLHKALRCKDSDSDSIYCLANVYLAVLYYTTGQYQTAIDHCALVMRSQNHSQCSSRVVQGELLPKIVDDIDNVLGLSVFYQYIQTAALKQHHTQYVVVFTTELFAHYLYFRCMSTMKGQQFIQMLSTDEVHRHSKYIIDMDQLLIADVLLLQTAEKLFELECHCNPLSDQCDKSPISATEVNSSKLQKLLQQSAVEHLTAYRQLQAHEFSSIATIVTTDFEALYDYKRGDYRRCFYLSTQNLRTLLNAEPMYVTRVSAFPQFIQLIDDDIASLIALTLIVSPTCRHNSYNVGINQATLSLYLMTQCQLKLRHPVASLAQTLDYIEVAQKRCPPVNWTLDRIIMKLTARKIIIYLSTIMQY